MEDNTLIIGAGVVGSVTAHKCAQNNDVLGNICIASRTLDKCEKLIRSIHKKGSLKTKSKSLMARQIDAQNISAVAQLIKETRSSIVINVGSPHWHLSIMEACLETNAHYIDTAVHEESGAINEPYPWYQNYEWTKREKFKERGLTAVLSAGFDPGVVNAYCRYAGENFDQIESIDILDINAGNHGKYFATNFDPATNLHELMEEVGYWEDNVWKTCAPHSKSALYDLPVVGEQRLYLTGHDELHSLSLNISAKNIRFWMGFNDHYINCFNVLNNVGFLNNQPVTTVDGVTVTPLSVVKACLPDPTSLAENYTGYTCIGNLVKGEKNGEKKELFIYNICDHAACFEEVEAHAISYTAGTPPVAAAILVANGEWNVGKMVTVEELESQPFIDLLGDMGLPTEIKLY